MTYQFVAVRQPISQNLQNYQESLNLANIVVSKQNKQTFGKDKKGHMILAGSQSKFYDSQWRK